MGWLVRSVSVFSVDVEKWGAYGLFTTLTPEMSSQTNRALASAVIVRCRIRVAAAAEGADSVLFGTTTSIAVVEGNGLAVIIEVVLANNKPATNASIRLGQSITSSRKKRSNEVLAVVVGVNVDLQSCGKCSHGNKAKERDIGPDQTHFGGWVVWRKL